MSSVIFQDEGFDEVFDCAGMTVGTAKERLRDSHNIPYFADAIVNGEEVSVAYVLGDGDRFYFRKRFGIKAGDDRPFEERQAEGLIHAYSLGEIVSAVKRRNLPKDESLDLMAVMVGQWAAERFGQPEPKDRRILTEILKRLDAIEARLKVMPQEPQMTGSTDPDQDWCHPASAIPPSEYPFGPLEGTQADLSSWLFSDGHKAHRRLHSKAQSRSVWVKKVHARMFEVWFRTEREFAVALRRQEATKQTEAT